MIDVAKGISMQHSRLRTKGYHCPIQRQELLTEQIEKGHLIKKCIRTNVTS